MASQKYSVEEVVKLMESDEPIFIFRGQDALTPALLQNYIISIKNTFPRQVNVTEADYDQMDDIIFGLQKVCREFQQWQHDNITKVKLPTP